MSYITLTFVYERQLSAEFICPRTFPLLTGPTSLAVHPERMAVNSVDSSRFGGARRDRTDDLLLAKQALSQLSYGPSIPASRRKRSKCRPGSHSILGQRLVGPGRLELPTSRLSGVRSNRLSYGPQYFDSGCCPSGARKPDREWKLRPRKKEKRRRRRPAYRS